MGAKGSYNDSTLLTSSSKNAGNSQEAPVIVHYCIALLIGIFYCSLVRRYFNMTFVNFEFNVLPVAGLIKSDQYCSVRAGCLEIFS